MTTLLRVSSPPGADAEFPLRDSGLLRLGRDPSCDLRINHPEVEPQAAAIELRHGECWIQNKNPYPIFVGQTPLAPEGWTHWHSSATVQLTKHVSLSITQVKAATAGAASGELVAATQRRNQRRWAVIGICALLGVVLLRNNPDRQPAPGAQQLKHLIEEFSAQTNASSERDNLVANLWEIEQNEAGFRPDKDFEKKLYGKYVQVLPKLQRYSRKEGNRGPAGKLEGFVVRRMDELATRQRR